MTSATDGLIIGSIIRLHPSVPGDPPQIVIQFHEQILSQEEMDTIKEKIREAVK